jgi:hypothetical protein
MNLRERILLGVLLGVLILGGCGALGYYVLYLPYKELGDQIAAERVKLAEKQTEQQKEEKDQKRILDLSPRLEYWKLISLPEPAKEEGPVVKGRAAEDANRRLSPMRGEYQDHLEKLLLNSGFQGSTLQVVPQNPQNPETKGSTSQAKTPLYTRLPFAVTGQATWASVVDMLERFHKDPLLHEVRSLRILRSRTGRQTAQAANQPAGPVQGPGGPGGRGQGSADPRKELLAVQMTVEVLMVNGAEHRDQLLPNLPDTLRVLAGSPRHYPDLIDKDMFHGKPARGGDSRGQREDAVIVLEHVKLTMLAENDRQRWYGTFYDQGAGGDEKKVIDITVPELSVHDMYQNPVFDARLVYIDARQLVLQVGKVESERLAKEIQGKYFRVRLGEMLSDCLQKPLTDDEIKELKIEKKVTATSEK